MSLIFLIEIIRLLSIEEAHDLVLFFHLQELLLLFVICFFLYFFKRQAILATNPAKLELVVNAVNYGNDE